MSAKLDPKALAREAKRTGDRVREIWEAGGHDIADLRADFEEVIELAEGRGSAVRKPSKKALHLYGMIRQTVKRGDDATIATFARKMLEGWPS